VSRREATFGRDIGAALEAWRAAPALPWITVGLAVLYDLPALVGPIGTLVSLLVVFVLAGWAGTQRIWYLRLFRNKTVERHDLVPLTLAFMGRYLALGFLLGIPFALVVVPVLLAVSGTGSRALVTVPLVFLGDFLGTFVTSALAFSTRHVLEAIRIGWRTLWDGWPATAPYALVAPLVVIGIGQTLGRTNGGAGVVVTVLGVLATLVCKGATTAYYLRQHQVGDIGAA